MAGDRVGPRRLAPEVRKLLQHIVERWHKLGHSQRHPQIPATTNRIEGWLGRFKPRDHLARGLKTETVVRNFVALMARGMA